MLLIIGSLFFLTIGVKSQSITISSCTSTDCTGTCTDVSVSSGDCFGGGSYTCSGNTVTVSSYTSTDCSGTATTSLDFDSGSCFYGVTLTCGDDTTTGGDTGSGSFAKVTVESCSSTDCTGTCQSASVDGCIGGVGYTDCSGGTVTQNTYSSTDCSGDATTSIDVPVDECFYGVTITCSSGVNQLSIFIGIISAIMVSLLN